MQRNLAYICSGFSILIPVAATFVVDNLTIQVALIVSSVCGLPAVMELSKRGKNAT